jgi:NAD(P)-dependent dehydrogenase (short-subunit alcohol dehydrogenase family)
MLSLITGVGAKGQVGAAVALTLGQRGDTLLVVSRSESDARARASELASAGCAAFGYGCDLSSPTEVDALRRRVAEQHGDRLDALVNLAGGFGALGPLADSNPAAFDHQLRINLLTAYLTTRAFLPAVQRARGSIVFFASEAVLEGAATRGVAAYVAAKAGVVALMRSVADEGREVGVRANAVAPAAIRTETNEAAMSSDARFIEREEVASVVAFLCSPASAAITGQVIRLRK